MFEKNVVSINLNIGFVFFRTITMEKNNDTRGYRDEKTNPQQAALLKRPNSSQYPSIGDSECKDAPIS